MLKQTLKTPFRLGLLSMVILATTACTNTVSRNVDANGHVEASDIIFPSLDKAWEKAGQFPNHENLLKVRPDMTKDELYQLLGRPHFKETKGAHEWDYIMKFAQSDNSVKICQYKVIFDKAQKAQEFYWSPADCANELAPAPVVQPQPVVQPVVVTPIVQETINLSADALFAFNKYSVSDIQQNGREELDALAQQLLRYQQQGQSQVVITGHTDYLGDESYNMNLSLQRAQTVRNYLISRGVDANTLIATGAGESQPVYQCDSTLSRAALIPCLQPNRRVEIAVSVMPR